MTSALSFKARVNPLLARFLACTQGIPQIHLWCDTCWSLRGQDGSRVVWSTYLHMCTGIGGIELKVSLAVSCKTTQKVYSLTFQHLLNFECDNLDLFWQMEFHIKGKIHLYLLNSSCETNKKFNTCTWMWVCKEGYKLWLTNSDLVHHYRRREIYQDEDTAAYSGGFNSSDLCFGLEEWMGRTSVIFLP